MCCGGRACPTGSETMSKTRLFNAIKALDLEAVSALVDSHPELARVKDERRRNAPHFLCGLPASDKTEARSVALARLLLDRGFDVNEPAFVEGGGAFKAIPLWYTLSRGRNLLLAKLLLKRGSSPEYCLWTAGFHDDVEAIDLLVKAGARLDPVAEDETPFLGAIHAPLAHAVPGLRRYVQSHIREEPTRPDIPTTAIEVDGIAELWYDDRAAMARAHASPEAKALFADGALFIGRIKAFVVEEQVIIP